MNFYNTGNPVPSNDPRDLDDNAKNLDFALNSDDLSFVDRKGVQRKTINGYGDSFNEFMQSFGWEATHLVYVTGSPLTVLRPTQLIDRAGSVYKVKMPATFPFALTGVWATDAPKLVDVGDQSFRNDLASPTGTTLVGRGAVTLEASLQTMEAAQIAAAANLSNVRANIISKNLSPAFFDMHYGALCGVGWLGNAVEIGGNTPTVTTATSASSVGSSIITVADPSVFRAGQLICFVGTDNTWYSAVLRRITGSQLQLDRTTIGVAIGASVIYFYANDAHPNIWGYYTIADTLLRNLSKKEEVVSIGMGLTQWSKLLGPETLSSAPLGTVNSGSYALPGTNNTGSASVLVAVTDINQGVRSNRVGLAAGNYHTSVILNTGERTGSLSGALTARIVETTADGQDRVIAINESLDGYSGIRVVDFNYTVRRGSSVSVVVLSRSQGSATFYLGQVRHAQVDERIIDLNFGTIVGFGDSWINSGFFLDRLRQRLPAANIINQGVSGNRMSQMVARFMTDVAPLKPRIVIMIGGTNDYFAGVTPTEFSEQANQVLTMARDIGAQMVVANSSVGDATYAVAPFERLTVSREYANLINFQDELSNIGWVGAQFRTANLWAGPAISIPAGQTVVVGAIPSLTNIGAFIRSLFVSGIGLNVRVGFSSLIDNPSNMTDVTVFPGGTAVRDKLLPKSGALNLFIVIALNNPTGTAISTAMVADIAWSEVA